MGARNVGAIIMKISSIERFKIKMGSVDCNGCINWIGAINKTGYGSFATGNDIGHKIGNKSTRAHRVSYILFKGLIPDGVCVLHACDNRKCVNPEHLFLGTLKDNTQDMIKKKRHVHGEIQWNSRLNKNDVIKIMEFLDEGILHSEIARIFNVSMQTIADISQRKSWKEIEWTKKKWPPKICMYPGCNLKFKAKGYCNKHFLRWFKYGDPNIVYKVGRKS